ncbi:MAG: hypothetical protein JNL48_03060, partial [Acidobacteria bacterium]|nr:hypothetical protein [Acidobacteriota bacterium]
MHRPQRPLTRQPHSRLVACTVLLGLVWLTQPASPMAARRSADDAAAFITQTAAAELKRCSAEHFRDNQRSPLHRASTDWFDVHSVAPGVFALVESRQQQEVISWLILGTTRA